MKIFTRKSLSEVQRQTTIETLEELMTDREIAEAEMEQTLTEHEIAIAELQAR